MRLDAYLFAEGKFSSRTRAGEAIKAGEVTVNGKNVCASYNVKPTDAIAMIEKPALASRGAIKLVAAFSKFSLTAEGKVCADIGASNGGFTQVLLERGAERVYAIDVGENQLDERLRQNGCVTVLDRTNARYLTPEMFEKLPSFITIDVSFISLTLVLPAVRSVLAPGGEVIALVKPQFEAGRRELDKHGIVKNFATRRAALSAVIAFAEELGFACVDLTHAPVRKDKNVEYLLRLVSCGTSREHLLDQMEV